MKVVNTAAIQVCLSSIYYPLDPHKPGPIDPRSPSAASIRPTHSPLARVAGQDRPPSRSSVHPVSSARILIFLLLRPLISFGIKRARVVVFAIPS